MQRKVIQIGTYTADWSARGKIRVQIEIEIRKDRQGRDELSICSTAQGTGGHYSGGQAKYELRAVTDFAEGWDAIKVGQLLAIWDQWHLNGLRAECEHQRARGERWTTHPSAVCPDCGYSLGSAWLYEPLPDDVVAFIESL